MSDRRVITGDEIRDWDFDMESIRGECVTVNMLDHEGNRPKESWLRTYYVGHVEGWDGEDEYRYLKIYGIGAIHSILLSWIDTVEVG